MKITKRPIRATHVNSGTSVAAADLEWPDSCGRVMRMPKLCAEVDARSKVTPYGGLALVSALVRRFKVAQTLDERVHVLKLYLPYRESDHVLALAMNFYVGGTCLEDIANLQQSEAVQRLVGSWPNSHPTTAGDFLRRFDARLNPGSLEALRSANDDVHRRVWTALSPRRGHKRKNPAWAVIDLDGHTKEPCGLQKEAVVCSNPPSGRARWTLQLSAGEMVRLTA